jgi:hypothetical protein
MHSLILIFAKGAQMTSDMTQKSYQAVRCLFCAEPIPLSTSLLSLCVVESEGTIAEQQRWSQVFNLRCEACSRESRYLKSEIENFEGDPPEAADMNRAGPRYYARSLRRAAGQ